VDQGIRNVEIPGFWYLLVSLGITPGSVRNQQVAGSSPAPGSIILS